MGCPEASGSTALKPPCQSLQGAEWIITHVNPYECEDALDGFEQEGYLERWYCSPKLSSTTGIAVQCGPRMIIIGIHYLQFASLEW